MIDNMTATLTMIDVIGIITQRRVKHEFSAWGERSRREAAGAKIGETGGIIQFDEQFDDQIEVFGDVDLKIHMTDATKSEGIITPVHGQWSATLTRIYYEDLRYDVAVTGDYDAFIRDAILIKMSGALDELEA